MGLQKGTVTKLILFNGVLIAVNVALFSRAFLGLSLLGGGALESAAGFATIVVSAVLFFYVNLQIINAPAKKIDPKALLDKLGSLESCHEALGRIGYVGTFSVKIGEIREQIENMQRKKELIRDILLQKFNDTEMSYQKFKAIVDSAEKVMVINIRSIINRIYAFDEEEYDALARGKSRFSKAIAEQKLAIFREYIDYVGNAVEDNDEILLRLDKLLFEISKFNSVDEGELEGMQALKELDQLITDTKWYR